MYTDAALISAFRDASAILQARFEAGRPLSEDTLRYIVFAKLQQHLGLSLESVSLESSHTAQELVGKKIDFVDDNKSPRLAIEFKYHTISSTPSGHAARRTMNAGELYNDLTRLALLHSDGCRRLFVYYTDDAMPRYLDRNKHVCFAALNGDRVPVSVAFIKAQPPSLQKCVLVPTDLEVAHFFSEEFGQMPYGDHFRVYEVFASPATSPNGKAGK